MTKRSRKTTTGRPKTSGRATPRRTPLTPSERTAELPFASFGRRGVGYVLDGLVVLAFSFSASTALGHAGATWLAVSLTTITLDVLYGTVMIHLWGSTLGMAAVHVRAVDHVTCERLPWSRAALRAVSAAVLLATIPLLLRLVGAQGSSTSMGQGGADLVPLMSNLGLVTFLWAKFDPLTRTLQDVAAGSVVVTTAQRRSMLTRLQGATRGFAPPGARTHRGPGIQHGRVPR